MRFATFAIVFAVVYAVAYALFTYHPALNEFGLGVQKAKDGPAMYWYGWMATSAIAGGIAGFAACFLPEPAARRLWPGLAWLVPLCAMLFFAWLLRGYFLR